MGYLAALDVGTTIVRCHIIDEKGQSIAKSSQKVDLLYPKPGYVEIDPDYLWDLILKVIKQCLKESNVDVSKILTMGISTQRCSIITWNIETGKHYHKFITWKDLRADAMVSQWNSSISLKGLRIGSRILYTFLRNKRFLAGSVFQLMNTQMTLRLLWALQNVDGLQRDAVAGKAVFGGVDSWLLYKFTGKHIADVSSASASGLFDPFTMQWACWAQKLFQIPITMFPKLVDTAGDFGVISSKHFGVEISISCSVADQSSSLFGSGCFKPGDMKVTMGTGSFVNVNTGKVPHASVKGLYPLVAWQFGSEISYVVEGSSNDTGSVIEWAQELEIIKNPKESCELAHSVKDSDGIYFVPSFSGLQAPINDPNAASGFLGVKPTSRKEHFVRAILESIVFRIILIYDCLRQETTFSYKTIRVDGGVSCNDFTIQLLADLTGLEVERSTNSDMSILGAAYLAGLHIGFWKNKDELSSHRSVDKIFYPNKDVQIKYIPIMKEWRRAVDRFKNWY